MHTGRKQSELLLTKILHYFIDLLLLLSNDKFLIERNEILFAI